MLIKGVNSLDDFISKNTVNALEQLLSSPMLLVSTLVGIGSLGLGYGLYQLNRLDLITPWSNTKRARFSIFSPIKGVSPSNDSYSLDSETIKELWTSEQEELDARESFKSDTSAFQLSYYKKNGMLLNRKQAEKMTCDGYQDENDSSLTNNHRDRACR
jgi:hypothetical protein